MTETTPLKEGTTSTAVDGPNYSKILVALTVLTGIGFGVAYGSIAFDSNAELHATKIQTIVGMDLQWLYLALVVLGKTILLLNFVPTSYKKGLKGNIRSNPFFYEAVKDNTKKTEETTSTMIGFKEDGPIGMYNRSNRSVQHMVENSGGFFAAIGPVGFLFPKQTLAVVCAFSIGRIVHQKGYANGYGSHALGFVFALFSIQTLEGLALIAFLKAQGYIM